MKKILIYAIILLIPFIFASETYAKTLPTTKNYILLEGETESLDKMDKMDKTCQDFSNVLRMAGYVILLVKIAVPLIIIVKSTFNLVKVITNGTPEELKKQATKLVNSCIAGIVIFFIPTIIDIAMNINSKYGENMTADARVCNKCIFHPNECKDAVTEATNSVTNGIQGVIDAAQNATNTR